METSFKPGFVSLNDINFDLAKARQLYLAHIRGVHQCLSLTMDMSRRDRQRLMQIVGACRYQRLLTDGFLDVVMQLYGQAQRAGIPWSDRSVTAFVRLHHPLSQKNRKATGNPKPIAGSILKKSDANGGANR